MQPSPALHAFGLGVAELPALPNVLGNPELERVRAGSVGCALAPLLLPRNIQINILFTPLRTSPQMHVLIKHEAAFFLAEPSNASNNAITVY